MFFSKSEKISLMKKYGEWALVTGASSGIGKELAKTLAEIGFNLILVARSKSTLEDLSKTFIDKYKIKVNIIPEDLINNDTFNKIVEQTKNINIGLLVNSAGFGTSGLLIDSKIKDEIEMIELNCISLFKLTDYFSKVFTKNKKGGIILLSSIVSFQGVPYSANYSATKAYVQSLGEALYFELKPFGVDVLNVAPGPVETGFSSKSNMVFSNAMKPEELSIPILKALGKKSTVFPGKLTKLLVFSLSILPRYAKTQVMKIVMGNITKHQRE